MVERRLHKKTYVLVFILTLLIFTFGLLLGKTIDNERIESVENSVRAQELAYKNLQIQYLYISTLPETKESCPILEATLTSSIKDLNKALEDLETYKTRSIFNKDEFKSLSRSYVLENLRFWLLAKKTRELCGTDIVTVLYFYSDESCSICPDQGTILSHYKRIFDNRLLVFPINVDLSKDDSSVQTVLDSYAVDALPTLVIGNDKYTGLISIGELKPYLCNEFFHEQPECGA